MSTQIHRLLWKMLVSRNYCVSNGPYSTYSATTVILYHPAPSIDRVSLAFKTCLVLAGFRYCQQNRSGRAGIEIYDRIAHERTVCNDAVRLRANTKRVTVADAFHSGHIFSHILDDGPLQIGQLA